MDAHLRKSKSKKVLINQGFIFKRIIRDIKSYTENLLREAFRKKTQKKFGIFQTGGEGVYANSKLFF